MKTEIVLTVFWLVATLVLATTANKFDFANITTANELAEILINSCKISSIACFWILILLKEDMIFCWIKRFFNWLAEFFYIQKGYINWQRKAVAETLMKPFLTCEICTGANLCFWFYSLTHRQHFVFLDLVFSLAFTTFLTLLTTKVWNK